MWNLAVHLSPVLSYLMIGFTSKQGPGNVDGGFGSDDDPVPHEMCIPPRSGSDGQEGTKWSKGGGRSSINVVNFVGGEESSAGRNVKYGIA